MNSQRPQQNRRKVPQNGRKASYRKPKRRNNGGIIGLFVIILLVIVGVFSAILCIGKNNSEKSAESETQAVIEETTAAPEPVVETKKVSFAAMGDNIMYTCNFDDARDRANAQYPEFNFTPIYTDILPQIQAADFAIINQETLMAGEEYGYSSYPCFNSPQALGDQLCDMGFDIIGMANNHMLDMGSNGLADTIAYWKTKPVTMIGGYADLSDYQTPRVVEKNGLKIGLLAYTYGTNGITLSENSPVIVPYINDEAIKADIARTKEVCDCVVVCIHWGEENIYTPTEEEKRVAQLMADEGVAVILGSHPHVIQPIEWLNGANGNKTLCIYSLGDFVATMVEAGNMLGGILSFDIISDADGIRCDNVLFTPTVHNFGPTYYNSKIYYLSDYPAELAEQLAGVYGTHTNLDELYGIVKNVMSPEFLPDYLKN